MTQEELSAVAGVSRGAIIAIEKGKRWPQWKNLQAMATVLKTDADEFFAFAYEEIPVKPPALPAELIQAIRDEVGKALKDAVPEPKSPKREHVQTVAEVQAEMEKGLPARERIRRFNKKKKA